MQTPSPREMVAWAGGIEPGMLWRSVPQCGLLWAWSFGLRTVLKEQTKPCDQPKERGKPGGCLEMPLSLFSSVIPLSHSVGKGRLAKRKLVELV